MAALFKKYFFLLHILIVVIAFWFYLTDVEHSLFDNERLLLWLPVLPDFAGIIYGIVGLLTIRKNLEKSESYRKGVFYIVIGILLLGAGT